MILIITILLLLLFLAFLNVMSRVTFLNKHDTCTYFLEDPDDYAADMNDADLHSQGVRTKEQFMAKACNAASSFTLEEKIKLAHACYKADLFFLSLVHKIEHIDTRLLERIPWILALTRGREYENGYPHTRDGIIFINDDVIRSPILVQILIHEKCHVFSRLYQQEMKLWLNAHKFKVVATNKDFDTIRANPDSDRLVYKDKNDQLMATFFRSTKPADLNDATYPSLNCPASEHPNESLAYYIDFLYELNKI